ncbi:hypothetical protein [Streptomyces sp. NPDC014623]|uniref:hypothetical protein n=1 Tax=Streptomyces sp. NPDC014623 TaxID=3364875 RepID=UPI0036F6A020
MPENAEMIEDPARCLPARPPPGAAAYVVLTRTQDIRTGGEALPTDPGTASTAVGHAAERPAGPLFP